MKRLFGELAAVLTGIVCTLAAIVAILFALLLFLTFYPPQTAFGVTGVWRFQSVFGVEERPLPPANRLGQDYDPWRPRTKIHTERVYLSRMGGMIQQGQFTRSHHSRGDTPMAHRTTPMWISHRPDERPYALSWTLHGKHAPSFLRFDHTERLYQLQPYGSAGDMPPKLEIVGIEGIQPGR